MSRDKDAPPDDGTALHALAELKRQMPGRYDQTAADALHAVERAQVAVIQANNAKSLEEEIRHLVRALAAAAEAFILAPRDLRETYLDALQRLDKQVATLAQAIPRMPPAPDELARRVSSLAEQFAAFLNRCEQSASSVEKGLKVQVGGLVDELTRAAAELRQEAYAVAEPRARRSLLLFAVGVAVGVMYGALVWRPDSTEPAPKPKPTHSSAVVPIGQRPWS